MRVSAYVLLAAFATSSPSSAFTPCSLYTAHQQTHQRTTTSRSAKDEKPSKQGAAEGSAKEAAAAATGTGLSASKAVPFVAPLAALAAGRQAMTKRELIRQEQIITEADLARIKKELANTDTAISASFGVAALTSAVALTNLVGVQFNGPKPAPQSPEAVSQRITKTPKRIEAPEPSGSIRKAPLALRTGPPARKAPVQQDETSSSSYDSLMSRLTAPKVEEKAPEAQAPEMKAPETKPGLTKAPDSEQQESLAAAKAPSFFDSMMKKIEDRKESLRAEEEKRAETDAGPSEKKAVEQSKVIAAPEPKKDTMAEKKEEPKVPVVPAEEKKYEPSIVENMMDKVLPSKPEENINVPAKADSTPIEANKAEPPKPDVKVEAPKPVAQLEAPKTEVKKTEEPKPEAGAEAPRVETKTVEEQKVETPKVETTKAEELKPEPKTETRTTEDLKSVVKAEAPTVEETKPELKAEPPKVESKKIEEPKPDIKKEATVAEIKKIDESKPEIPKTEEKKSGAPMIEVKPETPIVDVKRAEKPKAEPKAELPKAEVKSEEKAVAPVAASQSSQIDGSGTAIAVGVGVGVAALGIFAALLAAQDRGGDSSASNPIKPSSGGKAPPTGGKAPSTYLDSLKSTSTVQSWGNSSPSDTSYLGSMGGGKRATMKPSSIQRKPPRPENASSYLGALSSGKVQSVSSQTKAQPPKPARVEGWVSKEEVKKNTPTNGSLDTETKTASDGMMGPLVEEKKEPPRPAPRGTVSDSNASTKNGMMGPVAYVDALTSNQSSKPESKQAKMPEPWKPPKNGAKKPAAGGSYLDSLSGGSSGEMLPSIDESSQER